MTKHVHSGGINMLDIDLHFSALKATWIHRMINQCNFNFIPQSIMKKYHLHKTLLGIDTQCLSYFEWFNQLSPFYKSVILGYTRSNYVDNKAIDTYL